MINIIWHSKEKNAGNEFYVQKKFTMAIDKYSKALDAILASVNTLSSDELYKVNKNITLFCYLNLAACYLETRQYNYVITASTVALNLDPSNYKALKRRAIANTNMELYIDAQKDFESALENAPPNEKKKYSNRIFKIEEKKPREGYSGQTIISIYV